MVSKALRVPPLVSKNVQRPWVLPGSDETGNQGTHGWASDQAALPQNLDISLGLLTLTFPPQSPEALTSPLPPGHAAIQAR